MEVLIFLLLAAATIVPLFKLLPAYGINPYWSLVIFIPIGLIVLLWVMAARVDRLKRGTE
jgi:Na+-translocating ferredoxin:NAD+ oxidoreductase RnfE subunit